MILERIGNKEKVEPEKIYGDLFNHLLRYARRRLAHQRVNQGEEEDIAASVFKSLLRGSAERRFDDLEDLRHLIKLLEAMAKRKIVDRIRYSSTKKRTATRKPLDAVSNMSPNEFDNRKESDDNAERDLITKELVEEACESLPPSLKNLLPLRLQGFEHNEIAQILEVSPSTVARKLSLIRETWKQQLDYQI